MENSEWIVKKHVNGGSVQSDCMEFRPCEMPSNDLEDGHVLIQTLYISVDPYQVFFFFSSFVCSFLDVTIILSFCLF